MHVVNSLHFFIYTCRFLFFCFFFFGQNLAKHKIIYSEIKTFRHYNYTECSIVTIMAHVPLLIATLYRDVFSRGRSESTPPSSLDSKFKCTAIEYEELETSRVFGCRSCVQNTHIIIDNFSSWLAVAASCMVVVFKNIASMYLCSWWSVGQTLGWCTI